jgi:hypothetical protein
VPRPFDPRPQPVALRPSTICSPLLCQRLGRRARQAVYFDDEDVVAVA